MNSLNNSYNRYNNQPDPNLLNLREQQLYRGSTSEQRVVQASLRNPLNYQNSPNYKNEPPNSNLINEYQRQQYTTPQYENNQYQQGYYYQQDKAQNDLNKDPQYLRNLHKFYAVNEPPPPQRNKNIQRIQLNKNNNNGQFRSNIQNNQVNNGYANQALINDPQFQANLHKFYAVNEPPPPQRRPNINNSPNINQGYVNNNNGQYRPNIQNSQVNNGYANQAYTNDPQFQANLHKFYAVNEPPPPQRRPRDINNPYINKGQGNKNNNNGQYRANIQNSLTNDPQFQANLHKFYAVNEPPPPQKRQLNQGQPNNRIGNQPNTNNAQYLANLHKFYAVNEPPPPQKKQLNKNIGFGNQLNANNNAQYQANLHKFYAVNDPPPPQKISQNNGNRNIGQSKQLNINNPQYQANLHKFYAVNEPAPPPLRGKQQKNGNSNQGYGNPSNQKKRLNKKIHIFDIKNIRLF